MSMYSRGMGWHSTAKAAARRQAKHLGRYSHRRRPRKPRSLQSVIYNEYMQSPEWEAKRAEFFACETLPKTCLACGCDDVQLHHVTYDRLGCELLTDLVPLCHVCHKITHAKDPMAGKNGLKGFRKSLVYDFGIDSFEAKRLIQPYFTMLAKRHRRRGKPTKQRAAKGNSGLNLAQSDVTLEQTDQERTNRPQGQRPPKLSA